MIEIMPILAEGEQATEPTKQFMAQLIMWGPDRADRGAHVFCDDPSPAQKQKEEQRMRNSIRVGDEITTIGGICGRVVNIKEDALVIETGADRNKMTIKKWALQSCETIHDPNELDDDDDDDDD